jgi:hypothetical protein
MGAIPETDALMHDADYRQGGTISYKEQAELAAWKGLVTLRSNMSDV